MKDNVSIDLVPPTDACDVQEAVRFLLPEFEWTSGLAMNQGVCLSGKDTQGVKIQVWAEQAPITAIVSYYSAWPREGDRELRKLASISELQRRLGASFQLARVVM